MVGQGTRDVPEGLIHDWIGGVFIPNARIDKLLAVVHDYDRYKEIYPPVVTDSHSEARSRSRVFDDLETPTCCSSTPISNYQAHEFAVGPRRRFSVIDATSIQEIEEYGHSGQRVLRPDHGSGFMWRMHSISNTGTARWRSISGGRSNRLNQRCLTFAQVDGESGSASSLDEFAHHNPAPDTPRSERGARNTGTARDARR
jgi:hypothetical protein